MSTQRAIVVSKHGGSSVLVEKADAKKPICGKGQVVVENKAIGVNFIDTYMRSGVPAVYTTKVPFVPGKEGCGEVVEVGPGCEDAGIEVGDRVAYICEDGAYAQYTRASVERCVKLEDGDMTDDEGAALLIQGITAHYLVRGCHRVSPGDLVLVQAGAGGTGRLVIQMCKALGASVITTVGTPEKEAIARDCGADAVICYREEGVNVLDECRKFCEKAGKPGLNVAYDGVGKSTWADSLAALAPRGMLVLFGNASGAVPPIDPLALAKQGSVFVTRPRMVDYIARPGEFQERAKELVGWVREKKVRLLVGTDLSLFDARLAHDLLEARKSVGKVVLVPHRGADPGTPVPTRRFSKPPPASSSE